MLSPTAFSGSRTARPGASRGTSSAVSPLPVFAWTAKSFATSAFATKGSVPFTTQSLPCFTATRSAAPSAAIGRW